MIFVQVTGARCVSSASVNPNFFSRCGSGGGDVKSEFSPLITFLRFRSDL